MCSVQSLFSEVNLSYKDSQRETFPHPTPIIVDKTHGLILVVHNWDKHKKNVSDMKTVFYRITV